MIAAVPERASDRRVGCLRSTAWQAYNNHALGLVRFLVYRFDAPEQSRGRGRYRDGRASRIVARILKTLPASTGLANELRRRREPRLATCER
jgi:hypothetical protein